MEVFIIVGVIGLVIFVIMGISGFAKQKEIEQTAEAELKSNGINLVKRTKTFHGIIGIDDKAKKLVLIQSTITVGKTYTFNFSDIFECELIKDGATVYKKSATRTVGGAVVGGVLSGGVGAIIGGLSGGSKGHEEVKKIELKIVVRDIINPTHRFVFFDSSADNKIELPRLKAEAESWKDTLSLIIDMEDKAVAVV